MLAVLVRPSFLPIKAVLPRPRKGPRRTIGVPLPIQLLPTLQIIATARRLW